MKSDISFVLSINVIFNTGSQCPNESKLFQSDLNYYFNFDAEGPIFRFALNIPFGKKLELKEERASGKAEELDRVK